MSYKKTRQQVFINNKSSTWKKRHFDCSDETTERVEKIMRQMREDHFKCHDKNEEEGRGEGRKDVLS